MDVSIGNSMENEELPTKGKEQPGERPEGPRGGGQGGPVSGERDTEKEQSEPHGSVETPEERWAASPQTAAL